MKRPPGSSRDRARVVREIEREAAEETGTLDELDVVGGQSAGLIGDILPAAEIVHSIAPEAESTLA